MSTPPTLLWTFASGRNARTHRPPTHTQTQSGGDLLDPPTTDTTTGEAVGDL
jgi:hypothetical protein